MTRHVARSLAVLTLWFGAHAASLTAQVITPADVRADLTYLLARLDSLHPAAASVMDRDAVAHMTTTIGATVQGNLTRQQAWAHLARLNPLLADGHILVQYPSYPRSFRRSRATAGVCFPMCSGSTASASSYCADEPRACCPAHA